MSAKCLFSLFAIFFGGLNDALGVGRRVLFLKKYSVNENFQDDLHSQHNYRPVRRTPQFLQFTDLDDCPSVCSFTLRINQDIEAGG